MLALLAALRPLVAQIKALEREIAQALRAHPDGAIFRSLFRGPDSVICAATLLAEIGDCRARYLTGDKLAADAGQAAVAIESGKRRVACFRWACNKRLRQAVCTLADSTRHWHPWAQDRYASAIARATTTPARSAPSAAPGAASSGAAGKTECRRDPFIAPTLGKDRRTTIENKRRSPPQQYQPSTPAPRERQGKIKSRDDPDRTRGRRRRDDQMANAMLAHQLRRAPQRLSRFDKRRTRASKLASGRLQLAARRRARKLDVRHNPPPLPGRCTRLHPAPSTTTACT